MGLSKQHSSVIIESILVPTNEKNSLNLQRLKRTIDNPYSIGYTTVHKVNIMTREFVRLPEFEKQCKHIGLDENDISEIENILLDNPKIGDIIQGTGGIRKVRITLPNRGKSGGARVIYVDFTLYERIYFITAYAKSETEDLTKAEKNNLKSFIRTLEEELRKKG